MFDTANLGEIRPLGEEMKRLRTRARLSQHGLGALAKRVALRLGIRAVSWSTIRAIERAKIEKGRELRPEADTLRAVAAALATDPEDETKIDENRYAELFQRLMRSAGYTTATGPFTPQTELHGLITAAVEDDRVALALASGVQDFKRFNLHDQAFLLQAIRDAYRHAGIPDPTTPANPNQGESHEGES